MSKKMKYMVTCLDCFKSQNNLCNKCREKYIACVTPPQTKAGRPKKPDKKKRVPIRLYDWQVAELKRIGGTQAGIDALIKQIGVLMCTP